MTWDATLTYAATAIASGIAGGGAYKIIDSIVNGMKFRGDHKLSYVKQLDKLRREANIERQAALDERDKIYSKLRDTQRQLDESQDKIIDMSQDLEQSKAAEKECRRRLEELSNYVGARLDRIEHDKYDQLESRLRQLEEEATKW